MVLEPRLKPLALVCAETRALREGTRSSIAGPLVCPAPGGPGQAALPPVGPGPPPRLGVRCVLRLLSLRCLLVSRGSVQLCRGPPGQPGPMGEARSYKVRLRVHLTGSAGSSPPLIRCWHDGQTSGKLSVLDHGFTVKRAAGSAGREGMPQACLGQGAGLPSHCCLVSAASEAPLQGFCEFPAWLSLGRW